MTAATITNAGARAREAGQHAVVVGIGGGVWAFFGSLGLGGLFGSAPGVFDIIVVLALAGAGWTLTRSLEGTPAGDQTQFQTRFRSYLMIVRIEYGAIVLAVVLGAVLKQVNWIMPVVAVIVGVHFLALVNILERIPAIIKGVALIVVALVTVTVLPVSVSAGGHSLLLWALVPGAACALTLWIDGALALARGYRLRAQVDRAA